MPDTRLVIGDIILGNGTPWPDFDVHFRVVPSQAQGEHLVPNQVVTATTDENGHFEVPLLIGVRYETIQYTVAVSEYGAISHTDGKFKVITIPDGEVPITLAELLIDAEDGGPVNQALVDLVLLRIPNLISPMVHDALINDGGLVQLVQDTTEGTVTTMLDDYRDGFDDALDLKADATALVPLTEHVETTGNPHGTTKADIGLGSVPNVDATDRSTHTGTQPASTISDFASAADARIEAAKDVPDGIASLDSTGHIPVNLLNPIALTSVHTVDSEAAMLALVAQEGDIAIRTDVNQTYVHNGGDAGTVEDWTRLETPTDAVLSVAGKTGAVTLTKADVGLGSVNNTSDADKPISDATQTALNLKADAVDLTNHVDDNQNPHSVTAAQLGVYTSAQADTLLAGKAAASHALGVVVHGDNASAARPTGYAQVQWVGNAEPVNMVNGDTWMVTP